MTYQEYYNKLIKDLAVKEKNILKQHKLLKGEKGYLDKQDLFAYMALRHDLDSLLSKCDEVFKLITVGNINPQDEMDVE